MADARTRQKIKRFTKRVKKIRNKKQKFAFIIDQFNRGQLHSSAGTRVQNPKQARAIAYSMSYGRRGMRVQGKPRKPPKKSGLLQRIAGALSRRREKRS